jgi:hypothetical protein
MPRGRKKTIKTEEVQGEVAPAENVEAVVETKKTPKKKAAKTPPKIVRNEFGLLDGIDYKYSDDGFIDWKATIPPAHLFPNKDRFIAAKKEIPKTIEGLKDEEILIKISGLKWAARIRGYKSVEFIMDHIGEEKCVARCKIKWLGNYETQMQEVDFEDVASTNYHNCDGFAKMFLESIAANRAFSRCVRNFLNINIVSEEELGPYKENAAKADEASASSLDSVTPQSIFLKQALEKLGSLDAVVQFVNQTDVDTDGIKSADDLKSRIDVSSARTLLKKLNCPPKT